ncbi:MAG: hypothetical protein K0R38_7141 [Polyangiaceae bacterium]|jgi:hypothetical protein|nr:hypothetical protein [Polyangiaceae bacterium]
MPRSLNGWSDVDSLLFPVKLASQGLNVPQEFVRRGLGATRRMAVTKALSGIWAGLLACGLAGCGYQPAYASGAHYSVVAGDVRTAQFEAGQAALSGVRAELAAAAAAGGPEYPRVVVEVLRVDERSIGVRNTIEDVPLARGSEVVVVGRARLLEAPNAAATFDTGDMSRAAQFASGSTPSEDAAARSRAVRDAARSLGKALGRSILGLPEPAEG